MSGGAQAVPKILVTLCGHQGQVAIPRKSPVLDEWPAPGNWGDSEKNQRMGGPGWGHPPGRLILSSLGLTEETEVP